MCVGSADSQSMSVSECLEILPRIFFSNDNQEDVIPIDKFSHADLVTLDSNIRFLEELRHVPYEKLWLEAKTNVSKGFQKEVSCMEFESQTLNGKVLLIMELVQHFTGFFDDNAPFDHLCLRSHPKQCARSTCTEIFDAVVFESDVLAIISAVLYSLPHLRFLPKFIMGYVMHSFCPNHSFVRKVIRNFSHELFTIWRILSNPRFISGISNSYDCSTPGFADQIGSSSSGRNLENQSVVFRLECVVRTLVLVKPIYAQLIMEHCIVNRIFPGLTMDLILWLHEESKLSVFLLLKRLLLDSGPETRTWICDYLKQKTDHLAKLDHYLVETTAELIPADSSLPLSDDVILKALTLLRVLTALRGFVNYTFSPELSTRLLRLLTHQTCVSERGSEYITYALAFLIGLRSSLSCSPDGASRTEFSAETERTIVSWLQRLIEQQDYFASRTTIAPSSASTAAAKSDRLDAVSVSKPYVEPLLLLAILFHTNQPGPITELISNLLGLRIPSLGRTVNGWRKIFLNSVFTETMIANQAARIPITRGLSRRLASHLPIQCILQLLKSHSFAKNKLHIKEWVVGQLCESVRPLHPVLPELIEAHIVHAFGATPTTLPPADSPLPSPTALISEQDLIDQFGRTDQLAIARMCAPAPHDRSADRNLSGSSRSCDDHHTASHIDLTPALLFLYYALYVYDYQLTLRISTNRHRLPGEAACVYSDKLWECIPITYLLQYARAHLSDYSSLYPRLLQLVTNHLPHLTVGELIIQDELLLDPIWSAEAEANAVEDDTWVVCQKSDDGDPVCTPEELESGTM